MNNSINYIKYLYQQGVYSKRKMCELVANGEISEKDFHDITRLYYNIIEKSFNYDA